MIEKLKNEMPHEKFLALGAEYLTDSELLAIILRTGTKELSAQELAVEILKKGEYPREGILGLHDLSLDELMSVKGIGEVKAVKLKCLAELAIRMHKASAKKGMIFRDAASVAEYFMEELRHKTTEVVYLLCFDSKGQLIRTVKLSEGSINMSVISPRELFLQALQYRAVNIILMHNHPSGDPNPSMADRSITLRIKELGDQLDITLLDHIIIGDNRYLSFKEKKLM